MRPEGVLLLQKNTIINYLENFTQIKNIVNFA
jgi:hypothetical protein